MPREHFLNIFVIINLSPTECGSSYFMQDKKEKAFYRA
jgi:hypothetical protein